MYRGYAKRALEGQKTMLNPLELELKVMSYCVGPGTQTWVFCKNSKYF